MKINKDIVGKVFGVIAGVAGVISTVDGLYTSHKEKQHLKELMENYDGLKKTVEELSNKK